MRTDHCFRIVKQCRLIQLRVLQPSHNPHVQASILLISGVRLL